MKWLNWVLFEEDALNDGQVFEMKIIEASLSFILEDFVQVGLQYFYIEKFAFMPNDLLVYFNAMVMVYKALDLTYQMRIMPKITISWNSQDSFW